MGLVCGEHIGYLATYFVGGTGAHHVSHYAGFVSGEGGKYGVIVQPIVDVAGQDSTVDGDTGGGTEGHGGVGHAGGYTRLLRGYDADGNVHHEGGDEAAADT